MTSAALFAVLMVIFNHLLAVTGGKHSLLYLYTMESKNSKSNIYDCTAVTLLDDRQIDFYNSTDESRTAKQNWLKNISESDWKTSTEKLQNDRQLLNKLLDIQMSEFRHNQSDGHVLQWRQGCEVDRSLLVVKSISELAYDGIGLIYFNCTSETWLTSGKPTDRMLEKWNKDYRLIAIKKCEECVKVLEMYLQYRTANTTDINTSQSPPAVHVFANKSVRDSRKLTLICLITGFYPKDVKMSLRKSGTSLPKHLITSSGVRPNDDGTYQLRKSVEIQEDDKAQYDCYVIHSSLQTPVTKEWDGKCRNCTSGRSWTGFIGVAVLVVPGILFICVLICLKFLRRPYRSSPYSNGHVAYNIEIPNGPPSPHSGHPPEDDGIENGDTGIS